MERFKKNKKSFTKVLYFGQRVKFYSLLVLSFLIIAVSLFKPEIATQIKTSAIDFSFPILSFINRPFEEASDSINSITNIAALKAENTKLKAENERLKEWYQTALMLQAENKSLQSFLNLKIDPDVKFITARILSDTQNSFSKTILVSSSEEDGIRRDQAVLSGDGLLGRVVSVGKRTSRILLINDINSRIPVVIEGINKKAILSGSNENYLSLEYLEFVSPSMMSKKIFTSGEGGVFPPGLAVGVINKIEKDRAYVEPYSKMDDIRFVRILEHSQDSQVAEDF